MKAHNGFVLLELSVVLFLFVLLCTGAALTTTSFHKIIAHAEIQKLYAVFRYAQWRAVATGIEQRLVFNRNEKSYVYDEQTHTLPHSFEFGVLVGTKGPPGAPTHIITNPISFANSCVVFHPTGIISSGTVYIKDTANSALYALSNAVAHISFIRSYIYDTKWNLLHE